MRIIGHPPSVLSRSLEREREPHLVVSPRCWSRGGPRAESPDVPGTRPEALPGEAGWGIGKAVRMQVRFVAGGEVAEGKARGGCVRGRVRGVEYERRRLISILAGEGGVVTLALTLKQLVPHVIKGERVIRRVIRITRLL